MVTTRYPLFLQGPQNLWQALVRPVRAPMRAQVHQHDPAVQSLRSPLPEGHQASGDLFPAAVDPGGAVGDPIPRVEILGSFGSAGPGDMTVANLRGPAADLRIMLAERRAPKGGHGLSGQEHRRSDVSGPQAASARSKAVVPCGEGSQNQGRFLAPGPAPRCRSRRRCAFIEHIPVDAAPPAEGPAALRFRSRGVLNSVAKARKSR